MPTWAGSTALIVVDVQQGFDETATWGARNNPECEDNVAKLIEAWRAHHWPIVFVRHDAPDPKSPLRAGQPGNEFKEAVTGEPDLLVRKRARSAFHGEPNLDGWLRGKQIASIAICGIQTNVACESTARDAADLGYEVLFVIDAMHTFDIVASNHQVHRARDISRYTALTLAENFTEVVWTAEVLDATELEMAGSAS